MCQSILLLTHSLTGTLANYHIINISTLKIIHSMEINEIINRKTWYMETQVDE